MKYSILNKFGSAYTWSNIDNENYLDMVYIQLCMSAEAKANEFAEKRANFYSHEGLK